MTDFLRRILVNRGFTILELMVVVIIVGVLATMSIQHMLSAREMALEKEAISNLKIIVSAEKVYRLETESYIACNDLAAINLNLNLAISEPASPFWNYKVVLTGGGTGISVRAQRTVGTTPTTFCIDQDDINETKGCAWN